jgi:hypothetical protein
MSPTAKTSGCDGVVVHLDGQGVQPDLHAHALQLPLGVALQLGGERRQDRGGAFQQDDLGLGGVHVAEGARQHLVGQLGDLSDQLDPGRPGVVTDSADSGRQIIDHLAALGHRSLTYLGGPAKAWIDGERSRALSKFAGPAGIEVIRRGPFAPTLEGGAAAADIGGGQRRDGARKDRRSQAQTWWAWRAASLRPPAWP